MIVIKIAAFLVGAAIILATLFSAIRTFVLPRSSPDGLTRLVFLVVRRIFSMVLFRAKSYPARDRVMAFYAPVSPVAMVPVWLSLVTLGYTAIFWSLSAGSWLDAFRISGSSVLTLGFASTGSLFQTMIMLTAATVGLILVTLLIAYLPTMYAAFSRREILVNLLEVRAGSPPSAIEMLNRFHRIHGLDHLPEQWMAWENWFSDIEESHTSLAALVFFRSPKPEHSWVTASATILDAAAITLSSVDIPNSANAALCIRAGYLALRSIADYFDIQYNSDPHFPQETISVTRAEFDMALDELSKTGVPLKSDREQAWKDFAGWRVNYDRPLRSLAKITMAPPAMWLSSQPV